MVAPMSTVTTNTSGDSIEPVEIVGLDKPWITINWADGHKSVYRALDLRLRCRCAHCIEETTGRKILDPRTVPDSVRARNIVAVGQYAIGIAWSDGHATGIFSFRTLREGCPCDACALRDAPSAG